MSKVTEESMEQAIDLLYSFIKDFEDKELFSMQLIEVTNLAFLRGADYEARQNV